MNIRILCAGLLALAVSGPARAASLTLLPDWFDAPTVHNLFMLPDGKTFTGIDGTDVFRWSLSVGRTNLGMIPATTGALDLPISATDVSDDGSTIIGYVGSQFQAAAGFMWTAESGMVIMPNSLDETIRHAIPTAVSGDGKIIVGGAGGGALDPYGGGTPVAFRWMPTTGTTSLGLAGYPAAITPDGATIVGSRPATDPFSEAFRWNEQDGLQGLGFLSTGEWKSSHAQFVSNDGNIVIGFSFPENLTAGPKVFRWTTLDGMQQLSPLADTQSPVGIAADANVVLGTMQYFAGGAIGPYIPFLWTATGGLHLERTARTAGARRRVSAVRGQQVSLDQFNLRRRPHHLRNFNACRRRRNPVGSNPNLFLRALAPRAVTRSRAVNTHPRGNLAADGVTKTAAAAMMNLYLGVYNFCKVHGTLRRRRQSAAGLPTDHVWSICELLEKTEQTRWS